MGNRKSILQKINEPARKTNVIKTGYSHLKTDITVHPILKLQQAYGNQAVQRLLRSEEIQAKLKIGQQASGFLKSFIITNAKKSVQRFATTGHRLATVLGLKKTFSAEEIGLVAQANWERDLAQGPSAVVNAMSAWTGVKLSAEKNRGIPEKKPVEHFRNQVKELLETNPFDLRKGSMGGSPTWEHMDQPGGAHSANLRWYGKYAGSGRNKSLKLDPQKFDRTSIPGYILDSRAYIKDHLVHAVNNYRKVQGLTPVGTSIDNWKGSHGKPKGYEDPEVKVEYGGVKEPKEIAEERTRAAKSVGAKEGAPSAAFQAAADSLGRATHALEDFFAHSNWLEMARDLKSTGETHQTLQTGTFKRPSEIHTLGHKIAMLASLFLSEHELLSKHIFPSKRMSKEDKENYKKLKENRRFEKSEELGLITLSRGEVKDVLAIRGEMEPYWLTSKDFLQSLYQKGLQMAAHGSEKAAADSHAKLSKDQPGPGYKTALVLAIQANIRIVAPLRELMNTQSDEQANEKLKQQLDMVDLILAPPSEKHPLYYVVLREVKS